MQFQAAHLYAWNGAFYFIGIPVAVVLKFVFKFEFMGILLGFLENDHDEPYFYLFDPYKIIVSIFQFNNLLNPEYLLLIL